MILSLIAHLPCGVAAGLANEVLPEHAGEQRRCSLAYLRGQRPPRRTLTCCMEQMELLAFVTTDWTAHRSPPGGSGHDARLLPHRHHSAGAPTPAMRAALSEPHSRRPENPRHPCARKWQNRTSIAEWPAPVRAALLPPVDSERLARRVLPTMRESRRCG